MKRALFAAAILVLSALPASAASITIDSQNCSGDCFGLTWTLTVNELGGSWDYEAILTVADDLMVPGTPNRVVSAVDFKVAAHITSGELYSAPTALGNWSTYVGVLNSGGCMSGSAGFLCSQSSASPALFSGSTLEWKWNFNVDQPLFADLNGAHIGAKLTTLDKPGKLLSEVYTPVAVPEPGSLSLLGLGLAACLAGRRRARQA
jgi:hypothetical protein